MVELDKGNANQLIEQTIFNMIKDYLALAFQISIS